MSARRAPSRLALRAGALALALAAVAHAGLPELETEFRAAVARMERATVVVLPRGAGAGQFGVSGVIVSESGYVLTSPDAGRIAGGLLDDVDVRVLDPRTRTFTNFRGRVVARRPDALAAVVRIEDAPKKGFPDRLVPGTSEGLRVGAFAFVGGNSFGLSSESAATLTAGVIAAATRTASSGSGGGAGGIEVLYTTAAVNPGVAGGPLVDAGGHLVGIVAGWVDPAAQPESPYQFLGRVAPMDRVRAAFAGDAAARDAFQDARPAALRADEARAFETVFAATALDATGGVASLEIRRATPVSSAAFGPAGAPVELPRYRGPVSGVVASADGLVVTPLYNLTNLATLVNPDVEDANLLPGPAFAKAGIAAVAGATAHFAGGVSAPAKLLAVDEGLGIAVFRAELPEGVKVRTLQPAPAEALQAGRFVLAVANPFGAAAPPDPFVTVGILSKKHADDALDAWRGQWQTDARGTDGNCGAAAVDLRGRLLGVLTLWDVANQGRSSGISYVVPWNRVAAALPRLAKGESILRPSLGVQWADPAGDRTLVSHVVPGSAWAAGGFLPGDRIDAIDGVATRTREDCLRQLATRSAGDAVRFRVSRDGGTVDLDVKLGAR